MTEQDDPFLVAKLRIRETCDRLMMEAYIGLAVIAVLFGLLIWMAP